jgi:ABC-type transporter Mla subunit MlaD
MTDKSLTPDAAAEIDRYTKASIEKINDNANAIFSRVLKERDRLLAATASLDKLARDNSNRFHESATAAGKAATDMRALDDRVKIAQNDLEELAHTLNIVRAGAESVKATADHTLSLIGKRVALKSSPEFVMTAGAVASDGRVVCYWQVLPGMINTLEIPALALEVVGND